jgi:hypothetical protein
MRRTVIAVTLLVAASFGADTLMTQDFNAWWRTNNPPTGWRIFHTGGGPMGAGDWDQDSGIAPWTGHPTPFAGIYPAPAMDNTPDSLISPILDCRGYMNVTLRCSANFTNVGVNPYTAQIRYSIDSGATFPYVARDYYNLTTGTIYDSLELDQAMDAPGLQFAWVFYGDLDNIANWFVDDVVVTGEHHPYTVLFYEDFDTTWSTNNPPTGWRIFHTAPGDSGRDDWHRENANASPWVDHPSPFPAIATSLTPDLAPDSMISPAINCAGFRNITLMCSTLFYYFSSQPYTAQLVYSTDNGATWPNENVLHDYRFNHETGPIWEYLHLDNAKGKSQVRLAWVYDGDISYINWWSFDDVLVIGDSSPAYDVACESIAWPIDRVPPGAFQPSAVFRNVGDSTLTNVPVVCSLYTNAMVGLNAWTGTIASLMPDSESQVTFAPPYALPLGQYFIKVYSDYASDLVRGNDTLSRFFEGSMLKELAYDDGLPTDIRSWPVGHNGWGAKFDAGTFPVYIESLKVHLKTPVNPSQCGYQLAVFLDDGAGQPGKLYFKTPVQYATTGTSAWNSVFVGGAGQELVMPDGKFYVFYLQVDEAPECPYLESDGTRNPLASYWQYRNGVMLPDSTPGDFLIRAIVNSGPVTPALVDLRTLYVDQPLYDFVQRPFNAPITPKARVQNFGSQTVSPVTVECIIIGPGLTYIDFQTLGSLAPGQDTLVTFSDWTASYPVQCSIFVLTLAGGDLVPQNDDVRFAFEVLKGAHTGSSPLNYRWIDSDTTGGPTYSWIDTTGGGWQYIGELGDNNYQAIPFDAGMHFPYYDSTYDYVTVSSNGWVALGQTNPGGDLDTVADLIPTTLVPNRCVYAWWDNLAEGAGFGHGSLWFKWFGFAPDRYMVVVYADANRVGADTSNGITFELIFHENGTIICQYKDVETGDLNYDNARNSTIGLENTVGTDGLCYLYSVPPLSGGINGLANRLSPGRAIRFFPARPDAAALAIVRPNSYEFPGMITPQARIKNNGTVSDSIRVFMHIGTGYSDNTLVTGLAAGDSTIVSFAPWNAVMGTYTAACSVQMVGDVDLSNNLVTKTVRFDIWTRKADIPATWKRRKVKNAALCYAPTTNKLYAMKGSGTTELWTYDVATDSWDTLAPMPTGPSGRKPRDGVDFTFDPNYPTPTGPGRIWAIKGSGRPDFYYYDIANDTWVDRRGMIVTYRDWPYSKRGYRSPRRGAAIEYVAEAGTQGSVYGIPGHASNYFWRYDIASDSWFYPHDSVYTEWQGKPYYQYIPLDIPAGPYHKKCKYGSDLAYLNGIVYVLKGSNTVEAYGFSHIMNAWPETLDMNSFYGRGYRRVKRGGALVANDDRLYALKGGNTQQFWHYNFVADSWKQSTDIPRAASGRRVKVKRGSAMASAGATIFCLKGSNSYEFWEYGPAADTFPLITESQPDREGVMAEVNGLDLSKPWLTAYPNPTRRGLNISYNITGTAPTRLRVYDATGKVVTNLWDATRSRGQYVAHWSGLAANGKQTPAGIYFLKLESGDTRLTQKLIIQR